MMEIMVFNGGSEGCVGGGVREAQHGTKKGIVLTMSSGRMVEESGVSIPIVEL